MLHEVWMTNAERFRVFLAGQLSTAQAGAQVLNLKSEGIEAWSE